jgi:hypothetical protein
MKGKRKGEHDKQKTPDKSGSSTNNRDKQKLENKMKDKNERDKSLV